MTDSQFLEIIASLFVQSSCLILATAVLIKLKSNTLNAYRIWAWCHSFLLLQFIFAISLPHPRLFIFPEVFADNADQVSRIFAVLGTVLFTVWLTGFAVLIFYLVSGIFKVILQLRNMEFIPSTLRDTAFPDDSLNDHIRILCSSSIKSPSSWQIHSPTIVIPSRLLSFPENEKKMIIKHEMEHIQAGHSLHFFLQRLVESIYWFNPLVWYSSRQAIAHREIYCDHLSVQKEGEVSTYLKSLLHLAEKDPQSTSSLSTGLSLNNQTSLLKQRIEIILARKWNHKDLDFSGYKVMLILITLGFAISLGIWIPLNTQSTNRGLFSPWPSWSAKTLQSIGISVRDYEIDGHRIREHNHQ